MNKLKLYLAAHGAAAKSLEGYPERKPDKAALDAAKLAAFKDNGYSAKVDYLVFSAYFDDERGKMLALAAGKLPSEIAAEQA
jgi:hypothetical protein